MVDQHAQQLRLDGEAGVQQSQVVRDLVVRGDDDALAGVVELCIVTAQRTNAVIIDSSAHLRPARAAEALQHVLHGHLHEPTLLGRVDLRALDDHGVRRQVDPPGERRRREEHLRFRAVQTGAPLFLSVLLEPFYLNRFI